MKRAIYPGTFDPITYGHLDIIERSSKLFDEVVVGILINSSKTPLFDVDERKKMIEESVKHLPNIKVISFEGLLIDFAKEIDATVIVRGLRAVTDFEYEFQMTQTNKVLSPDIDTIFFTTSLECMYISSSTVREVAAFGGDISKFVPENIERKVKSKFSKNYKQMESIK